MKSRTIFRFTYILAIFLSQTLMPSPSTGWDQGTYYEQGTLYLEQGKLNLAINAFTQAIRENPSYVEAYNNRALVYCEMGRMDKAKDDLLWALSLDPQNEVANSNLGVLFVEQGDYQNALIYLERAVQVPDRHSPYFLVTLRNLAFVYEKLGMVDEAMRLKSDYSAMERSASQIKPLIHRTLRCKSFWQEPLLNLKAWKLPDRR